MRRIVILILTLVLLSVTACASRAETMRQVGPIWYENQAIVLLYHDVVDSGEGGAADEVSTIRSDQFEAHLLAMRDNGYRIISMEDFVEFILNQKPIPANAVVITFDDGYENFYTHAYPILQKHGVTASNFIIGIYSDTYYPDAEPHLTWEQMKELKQNGMGIYSHTYNLHRTANTGTDRVESALTHKLFLEQKERLETDDEFKRRIKSDLEFMNRRIADELGEQTPLLAFPYGEYTDLTVELAEEAGIPIFFTTREGINSSTDKLVYRINAGEPYMTAEALIQILQKYSQT
ncbi:MULTISPECIES: polysaccharide deacetylase family protein [Paenibacillus]|uniref:Polysaccharide deacetylase family protein n=1 Tax=Paenibacillus residui TaxID=629724 RepID=A0ABW3DFZ4_9BACL